MLDQKNIRDLFAFIMGVVKKKGCHLYRINGMEDHIHILSDLNPSVPLAYLVRDIKSSSSTWIKEQHYFPMFNGWAEGYGAFTCSHRDKDRIIAYIKNQQQHHQKVSFIDEYRLLLLEHGVTINEKFFP